MANAFSPLSSLLSPTQKRAVNALTHHRFFKLIGGGSFTEASKIKALSAIYAQAGMDCIDVAPDLSVVQAVEEGFTLLPTSCPRPMVMVSLPLDPDPHFRKIDIITAQCVLCDVCIPVCPTNALSINAEQMKLLVNQPLCYGCGRCVTDCPTDALVLHPLYPNASDLRRVLQHPLVEAVELHTRYADPSLWPAFQEAFGSILKGKLLAICFRPDTLPSSQWLSFLDKVSEFYHAVSPGFPLIIQVDGAPMSGSDHPEASLPAFHAALEFYRATQGDYPWITLSGGINRDTARYLHNPRYGFIRGVGMGTVARTHIWPLLESALQDKSTYLQATRSAFGLVQAFKTSRATPIKLFESGIIETGGCNTGVHVELALT